MQDMHYLTGGGAPAERLFAAAAGDRRFLRPSNQALKCPRCDSLNTKFCYYNNYNLSQPRHFCKSCRRYWTKGGVLRNVPVGGGCRKSKRSSSSSSSSKSSSSKPPPSPSPSGAKARPHDDCAAATATNNNNHSSSDSSMTAAAVPPAVAVDIPTLFHEYGASCIEKPATTTASMLYGVEDIAIDHHHGSSSGRDDVSQGVLTEIGNFAGPIGSTAEIAPFSYEGLMGQHGHQHQQTQDMVVVDGYGPLDWEGSGEGDSNGVDRGEGLYDVTGAVDDAYWSQQDQWTASDDVVDHHHPGGGSFFLP